ncbi:hypothetical protein ABZ806_34545 [Spirillospora sp. NPDC047418]|jgi:hypothetical protein
MSTCQAEYVRTPNAQGTLVATGVPHDGPTVAVHPGPDRTPIDGGYTAQ